MIDGVNDTIVGQDIRNDNLGSVDPNTLGVANDEKTCTSYSGRHVGLTPGDGFLGNDLGDNVVEKCLLESGGTIRRSQVVDNLVIQVFKGVVGGSKDLITKIC